MVEEWKWIQGYENLYKISSLGRITRLDGEIRKPESKTNQYPTVVLTKNGKNKTFRIHRLVAQAFIPNPESKPEVNHKDMNKNNNAAENLEWVTPGENIAHAIKNNPEMIKAMNRYNRFERPKLVIQLSLDGEFIACYVNATIAAKATGVCSRNITQVASKDEYRPGLTRKQAGGFLWQYLEEGGTNDT
jgi:hypothetical protein